LRSVDDRRGVAIRRWWPTTQSLDLVDGPVEAVAGALHAAVARFVPGERLASSWEAFPSLDSAFSSSPRFANVPTTFLVLPTRSRWSVLWNNSFLCNGYDSLCRVLTEDHGLTTVHWYVNREGSTFQPGTSFTRREARGSSVAARSVAAIQDDGRWRFHQSGDPLPEEDLAVYATKRIRERLDEAGMVGLLGRMGARPWADDFYALPGRSGFVLHRADPPATVQWRSRTKVRGADGFGG
jgi:hypothetical protein